MLITDEYRRLNAELHVRDSDFGNFAGRYRPRLLEQLRKREITQLLDYGCGKSSLRLTMAGDGVDIFEYDPAIPGKDTPPEPADAVCCIATMEHVEPGCVDDVLDDIRRLSKRMAYFVICTRLSGGHFLPDGRNPHLTVHGDGWWEEKLKQRWASVEIEDRGKKNFVAVCE